MQSSRFEIPYWQVDYGTQLIPRVVDCLENLQFSMGKGVINFENEISKLLKVNRVIGVTSGSDAILMTLIAFGAGPGKKVLLQDRSWIAVANALGILGCEIILVDINHQTNVLDLDDLESKYAPDVIGLVVVEMNGRAPNMEKLSKFCVERNIFLLEDSAQALGSKQQEINLGTFGDAGCFSLSTAKLVGSGQGGFIVTHNERLADALEKIRLHGNSDIFTPKWESLGFNFRLTDLHAVIGSNQLVKLEERRTRQEQIFKTYENGLASTRVGKIIPINFHTGELGPYIEFVTNQNIKRSDLIQFFLSKGIEVRPFYPSIMRANHYLKVSGHTPNAIEISERGIYLPSGPSIRKEQIERVVEVFSDYELVALG